MQDMSELPGLADRELDLVVDRARWTALVVLCAGMLMIVLDVTIVNVALPSIQQQLGFSATGLAWVVNAYLISFGGLLLLAGRLGDLAGRRNVFLAGLAVFTAASMAAGWPSRRGCWSGARFVQGIGGAMTSAVILGVIVTMFPDPREMARAIGVYAFVASAGGAVGLLAGGILTQAHQLALDLLREPADRHRHRRARAAGRAAGTGAPGCAGRGRAGRRAHHERDDAGRLHHRQAGAEHGWLAPATLAFGRGVAGPCSAAIIVRQ